ncbi:hypothetical protein B0H17DRAFT_1213661 [Mycena rosella]|uniref:Uncharacterized protein n=1 Tax=Mycena rosella TaxID=1033263 RepID=A0AAD7CQK0_MYCRO|nr:hypothetical protein B0H17DRAFT_1213661 [Mycena rosella]
MLQLCRAEDGAVFQVPATIRDIERLGSLEYFLHQETGVPPASALEYLPDGSRLTNGSLRELAAASTLFVFDKGYLKGAVDDGAAELRVDVVALLLSPFEGHEADAYLHAAQAHAEAVASVLAAVRAQAAALRVAGTALDLPPPRDRRVQRCKGLAGLAP